MSTATAPASEFTKLRPHVDPYQLDPADVLEPPIGLGNILKEIGPGIVLSASIVGSGELIATTTLGAEVGYTVMWLIILSCLIKAVVQSFLGRYTIARGETGLQAFNRIPGTLGKVNWVVWAWAAMIAMKLFLISGMFIGVSQAMKLLTGVDVVWWVLSTPFRNYGDVFSVMRPVAQPPVSRGADAGPRV